MSSTEILPICTTRSGIGGVSIKGVWHVPVYCMFCGKHHGFCPEEAVLAAQKIPGYVGYVCDLCAENTRNNELVGIALIPDQVHWQRVADAQREEYGRELTLEEQAKELSDVNSALSRIIRG